MNDARDVVVRGAARFSDTERAAAAALAVGSLVFGWSTSDDLFFIPIDGSCVLMTDHHRQLVGNFPWLPATPIRTGRKRRPLL